MSELLALVYNNISEPRSDERRELFEQVSEFCKRFVGRASKDFDTRIKHLHFTGELSLQKEGGEGMTPAFAPLALCLCAPLVSEEEFRRYFEVYGSPHSNEVIAGLMGSPIKFGKLLEYPLLLERWNMIAIVQRDFLASRDQLHCRLADVFWLLAYRGSAVESLTPVLFSEVEKKFDSTVLGMYADKFEEGASEFLSTLFSGTAQNSRAYEDPWFVEFCRRFFSRDFATDLQAYFDSVYKSVNEAERITFDGNRILLPAA